MLLKQGINLGWLGVLLSGLSFVVLFGRDVISPTLARTNTILPLLSIVSLAGVGLAGYAFFVTKEAGALPFVLALFGGAGFVVFTTWFCRFGRRVNDILVVGKKLPAFSLDDDKGAGVESSEFIGKPALFMFYRGNWCPFCTAQVNEIAKRYRDLIDRGVEVALITPQSHDFTRRVAESLNVPFRFLVDEDLSAARALDLVDENGVPMGYRKKYGADTVLPTVIITDAAGTIIFAHQTKSYRVRPNPDVFFGALAANGL